MSGLWEIWNFEFVSWRERDRCQCTGQRANSSLQDCAGITSVALGNVEYLNLVVYLNYCTGVTVVTSLGGVKILNLINCIRAEKFNALC